ncbi:hypothetical protein AVEN_48432-1 [Araneus ventricosus]|uniref:Uncharacterized protein n=1 Tax=Araneus ventricosus TaxID=182803 RepID=A0A4Y2UBK0_ARAVE|nr:hypothetical protein AVEN_48432-1 [Araneus ventricosus]
MRKPASFWHDVEKKVRYATCSNFQLSFTSFGTNARSSVYARWEEEVLDEWTGNLQYTVARRSTWNEIGVDIRSLLRWTITCFTPFEPTTGLFPSLHSSRSV